MNNILGYWIIGCVLSGLAWGSRMHDCPNDKYPINSEILIVVAVWPASVPMAIIGYNVKRTECEVK